MDTMTFDDEPPPEPRDGWLLVRIFVPELNVYKCLQFPSDKVVWDVKQQCLASLPKELKESFNYGLFCPPSNGKAGKFLDEERRLGDYPFNGPVGYLELKYKRRVYKMLNLDERQLKALHTRANLRRFLECINGGHVEKIAKMCAKGLDPNFHCQETGETPLTIATGTKKPNKLLIALVNGGALLDYRTRDGATALHRAVERDSLEAVSTLLELGASPNYRDTKGLTPVYLSVTRKTDPKICEILLHDHATLGIQDSQGWQEVHQACRNGLVHHLEHLLFYGADMDGQNASGNTPLHVCAVNNQEACARMLLFRGANRGALNYANQTPYQVAVIAGNLELAEMIQNYKCEDIDKSLGDTSDIISDSSGVGTNSDSAACSIGHPSTTVVCMEGYDAGLSGHINIQPGDVIEVVGSTDCGLLEGFVRGTNKTGFFPAHCVQEVQFRQKSIINVSTSTPHHMYVISTGNSELPEQQQQQNQQQSQQYNSQTAPRTKKAVTGEPRNVVLHRAKRGFGFILRGAKASSPLMQLKPSPRCPALQYLDDVDPGGVADMAGLKPGDFLLAINNEDVTCASHEHVVDLIRNSGSLVSMTVITLPQNLVNSMMESAMSASAGIGAGGGVGGGDGSQHSGSGMSTPVSSRQCSTLPRRMNGGVAGLAGCKLPAPMPPRRDPKTTLSVGRARAKSMVAGLEGGGEKDDDDLGNQTKSTSAESIHQQSQSAISTPTQGGPGTPIQPRTASIKARPTSSRITAAELEELFQRQQGADANRCSMLMSSSRFQSGFESSAATPPTSPQKGPIVYASVAEMKRKKSSKIGTLKGRPIPIPQVGSDLKRTFHSTPDLATAGTVSSAGSSGTLTPSSSWFNTVGHKGHRSQDDVHSLHMSMQRLNLPPPNHPPPPPPIGQVVKVEISRGSEYECLTALQKHIQQKAKQQSKIQDSEIMSSFKPASNAKLYASPQDIRNVGYRTTSVTSSSSGNSSSGNSSTGTEVRKASSLRSNSSLATSANNVTTVTIGGGGGGGGSGGTTAGIGSGGSNPYAQPGRPAMQQLAQPQTQQQQQQQQSQQYKSPPHSAPPLPDPDYSLSESDTEEDNSVRLVRKKVNGTTGDNAGSGKGTNGSAGINPGMAAETSGNSNTSGSSSGSSSIPHSFSVEEIQKIRTKLKSSKSYPNDFLRQQNQSADQAAGMNNEDNGDNSSSGVSSDQEVTVTCNEIPAPNPKPTVSALDPKKVGSLLEQKKMAVMITSSVPLVRSDEDDDESPSPPATGFQRHNSLTRKQAATIAAQRAKANQQNIQHRHAVTLATLPPPIEADSDEADSGALPGGDGSVGDGSGMVLPPPAEFSDSVGGMAGPGHPQQQQQQQHHHHHHQHQHQHYPPAALIGGHNPNCKRVRIVGAVPKVNRLNSQ
ncbi:SH3 and multiple ankyrin repeat domains protein 1 isoform X2 [Sabethes cyaneus]|uniref:SH3 and multiple ankyrin repeat domains protein 1 isoform X2 n=1 Tax=Sabethes cyaneus TaxID=53552 RepID=UPI00237DB8D2|nr:SH3 and multiple ankyrin repeat domains protein 1 isoform X2 [Sabethes cyaneus]